MSKPLGPLEKVIETKVCAYAKAQGFYCRKYSSPTSRSVPDRIFGFHGAVFWIEFKRLGEEPTPAQEAEHKEMRAHGLTVYVADTVERGKSIINQYLVLA